jgi:membrane protein YqaA with SNARE-associated domain
MGGYLLLFASAFLAATIVPFYSEVVLYALIRQGESAWLLISVASIGNTLGAAVNWVLGRFLLKYQDRRWFYFKPEQIAKSQRWFQRYGVWSLLFAWLPVGGDALTFIAGVMRVRFMIFIVLVGFGKTCRYIVILYLTRWSMTF